MTDAPDPWPPPWGRWVAACTAAEFIGMAAAGSAALLATALIGEPTSFATGAAVIALSVLGGAVEGLAVGWLQFRVLRPWLPALSARRYVGGTVALAAAFWLLAMTAVTVGSVAAAGQSTGEPPPDPPIVLVALAAALGGAVGGVAFGLVQGWALRGHVPFPWRWIRPNAVGWALAVAIITVGATVVPGTWPTVGIVAFAAAVGVLAGGAVGVVTGQALPALEVALPWWNRTVVDLLLSPMHVLLSRGVVVLRYRGPRSGRTITLPVQYAADGNDSLTVQVGHPESKTWWRSFVGADRQVMIRLRGRSLTGTARALVDDRTTRVLVRVQPPHSDGDSPSIPVD